MKNVSLNFGAIRDTIYNFSSKELIKENVEKSEILKKFLKEIKDNHVLKIQYLLFKNLEKGNFKKERLAERYINQNVKLLENIKWDNLLEVNKNLRKNLLENYHVEGDTPEKNKLYEAIHSLIESTLRPNFYDISSAQDSYEYILNHLLREDNVSQEDVEEKDMPKFFSYKYITELAVSNFNKRYAHLNENEKGLLKILLSTEENKTKELENVKNENIQLIDDLLEEGVDENTKKSLQQFSKKMKKLPEITEKNINEVIINCTELNGVLKEI